MPRDLPRDHAGLSCEPVAETRFLVAFCRCHRDRSAWPTGVRAGRGHWGSTDRQRVDGEGEEIPPQQAGKMGTSP